jgi:hypothetical protein
MAFQGSTPVYRNQDASNFIGRISSSLEMTLPAVSS